MLLGIAIHTSTSNTYIFHKFCAESPKCLLIKYLLSVISSVLPLSIMVLTAKFPPNFVKFYTLGQGMTGIFSDILQIIAITVGKDATQTALIYFLSGTSILLVSFFLFYFSDNLKLYKYYMAASEEDLERPPYTWNELKPVLKLMTPTLVNIILTFVPPIFVIHPNLTSLIRSEYYSDGSPWSSKYFFLLPHQ